MGKYTWIVKTEIIVENFDFISRLYCGFVFSLVMFCKFFTLVIAYRYMEIKTSGVWLYYFKLEENLAL